MNQLEHKKCLVCNNVDISSLKGFESLCLVICNKCKFVFDKRIPTQVELDDFYKMYSYSQLKPIPEQTKVSYNLLLDQFENYRKTENILDVGCGQGDFLVEAKKRGWNVYGTEFSEAAIELCQARGINMHKGELLENDLERVEFDVITSFEVIEHINNPSHFMQVAYSQLKNNGLFYCTTPNFNSILRFFEKGDFKMIAYPEHISFYTKKSITYLGRKHSFKTAKIATTGLDIGRLKTAIKSEKKIVSMEQRKGDTAKLQKLSNANFFMKFVKKTINVFLTILGKGDTIKVFWIKKIDR